ncbi:MAG: NAD(P)-dependent oxidoreductase [Nitrosopumilus sp. B06]|nr:MAG: NAD(P)-dependent oxidoreductase [Nitrosopumilus sp. B06]
MIHDGLLNVLIIGAAGVIGSALTRRFLDMGMTVKCMDVCRFNEAWRLAEVEDCKSKYVWKASNDLVHDDVRGVDIIVDCGLGVADRPMGNSSPSYTVMTNISPSLRILETIKHMDPKQISVIYPSSFNTLYGYPAGSKYTSQMLPNPSSVYGWTKAAVESLYMTYQKAHGISCVVTRVGSGYGFRMRSDEFPAQLMLNMLMGNDITVRSPEAKRLWTYGEDIVDFYGKLVENLDQYMGQTIHCAGNVGDSIVTNMSLARMVAKISDSRVQIRAGPYEPGEVVDGKPISFTIDNQSPLWSPKFTLEAGMQKTFGWFEKNLSRYC